MTTNYREILRLKSLGLNKTDIARSVQCARNTVSKVLERAEACGLHWPLPEGMSDRELAEKTVSRCSGESSVQNVGLRPRVSGNSATRGYAHAAVDGAGLLAFAVSVIL